MKSCDDLVLVGKYCECQLALNVFVAVEFCLKCYFVFFEKSFKNKYIQTIPFVVCFGVEFLCCLNLMYVFIFLFKFG